MEFEDPGYTQKELEEFVRLYHINHKLNLSKLDELIKLVFGNGRNKNATN